MFLNQNTASPTTSITSADDQSTTTSSSKNGKAAAKTMAIATISKPTITDILCGKDKTYARHEGNKRFSRIIRDYVEPYTAATTKQEKMQFTKQIVLNLQTKGSARFLKMVGEEWQEISSQNARDKTSHALRFAAAQHSRSNSNSNSNCSSKSRKSSHRRNISADSYSGSSQFSSCSSSVSSYQEGVQQEATVVNSLFDRQQHILTRLRTDFECDDEVRAITARTASTRVTVATAVAATAAATAAAAPAEQEEQEEEFNTLRSEDLARLLNEPLVEGEWENVMDLAR
jgi:hypothetical protein